MTEPLATDVEIAKQADCAAPEDLGSRAAREVIGRAAIAFLQGHKITPLELLHGPGHQRRLMESGTQAMQAVQKAAGWQVRGSNTPVTERVREIWDLTDAYRAMVVGKLEPAPAVAVTQETISDVLAWRDDETGEDRAFRIYACLTATLEPKRTWGEKAATLLGLLAGVAGLDASGYFDAMLAEILRSPKGLAEVLGSEAVPGDQVDLFLDLVEGRLSANKAPKQPATAAAIYELLGRAKVGMVETRMALIGHAVRIVRGNDKLTNKTVSDEVAYVVKLRDRLSRSGELVGGAETQEALERRLSRSISDQSIDLMMADTNSVAERVLRAVQLHSKIFGEVPRGYLQTYVTELMGQDKLEARLLPDNRTAMENLTLLGKLHAALIGSEIAERTRERLAIQAERAQADLITKAKILETFESGKRPVGQRLSKLLTLISGNAFCRGDNAANARNTARAIMKQPGFFDAYLADVGDKTERAQRLRDLEKKLAEAQVV
ncbi:MAG: hypothetical protein NXI19_19400 [Alphaproteobacteria bacterium]|nr:hypothetical protein [Alphaproteobacteria bacterium]